MDHRGNETEAGYTDESQISSPSSPASGLDRRYFKSDDLWYRKTHGGEELAFGWLGVPLGNGGATLSAAYTSVLADQGRALIHDVADNTARIFTIDSNANVAYPLYTVIMVVNLKNTLTIKVTTDTQTLANSATTGDRTLAVNGVAIYYKIGTTGWLCWGPGLT